MKTKTKSTLKKSGRKSTNLPPDFVYEPDFWAFYKSNKSRLEALIGFYACRYLTLIDFDDMMQEILLRLAQSNFLETYDPSRGSLFTHTHIRVFGHASHIAQSIIDDNYGLRKLARECGIPMKKAHKNELLIQQVLADNAEADNITLLSIESHEKTDSEIMFQSLVNAVREHLPDDLRRIFDMKMEEYTNIEIAGAVSKRKCRKQGVSPQYVNMQMNKIKARVKKILAKERV